MVDYPISVGLVTN